MNIRDAVRQLARTGDEIYCKVCTVTAVNEEARTVDCMPLDEDEAPILDVNLQANQENNVGIVVFPAIDSYVVVAFLNQSAGVVVLTDQVDKVHIKIGEITTEIDEKGIVFNGGDLGGLIKIAALTQKLNDLRGVVNDLINKYNSHVHETTATVGETLIPGELSPTESRATKTAQEFVRTDYENEKVKH